MWWPVNAVNAVNTVRLLGVVGLLRRSGSGPALILMLGLMMLPGCGFSPLYGDTTPAGQQVQQAMHGIQLGVVPPGRVGQVLSHELESYFARLGDNYATSARYRLDMQLKEQFLPLIVRQDGNVSRYNIDHTLEFSLRDLQSGGTVHTETIRLLTGYSTEDSDYASFTSRKEAQRRAMRELAAQTKGRLMAFFSRHLG